MVLACQKDSFLKEYKARVLQCSDSLIETRLSGRKDTIKGYEVILQDTIFFPEGGGQPSDQGYLNTARVLHVTRRGDAAVHYVDSPLKVGQEVKQILDWEKRLDHMQQHSGQHLISALGESVFNYKTTAWWLGAETSFVELDTPSLEESKINQWEALVNQKIQAAIPVSVKVYERDDPSLSEAHTRGLPQDHTGPIRVVDIDGIDSNQCCGTHVSNLSQLQMIKMLHCEKGKKNKVMLHFLVGGRVLHHFATMLHRENALTALLKNAPSCHVKLVEKLQKDLVGTNKQLRAALNELAEYDAKEILKQDPCPSHYAIHRKEGDSRYMNTLVSEVEKHILQSPTPTVLFLTVGDDAGEGLMVLFGDHKSVAELGPELCKMMGGKGACNGPKFQGKVSNMSKRPDALKSIQAYMNLVLKNKMCEDTKEEQ